MPHALIIGSDASAAGTLCHLIAGEGFECAVASTLGEARDELQRGPDVVLLDPALRDGDGWDLLSELPPGPRPEVIMIDRRCVGADSNGAPGRKLDWLGKPVDAGRLHSALARVTRSADAQDGERSAHQTIPGDRDTARESDLPVRSFTVSVGDRIDTFEKQLILATVRHTRTREAAAAMLGISVKTLYNRLKSYER